MGDEERRKEEKGGERSRTGRGAGRCLYLFAGGKGSSSEAGDKARAVGMVRWGPKNRRRVETTAYWLQFCG